MGNTCISYVPEEPLGKNQISAVQAYFDRKNRHVRQAAEIKILSYNIFIRPPGINNNGNDHKDDRLNDFISILPKYDIICLQEMFGSYSNRRSELIDRAADAGFGYSATSSDPSLLSQHFIDGGLVILSRFPIVTSEFLPYSAGIGCDYYVRKGALYAQIRIGNSNLHLYNTHTQATYDTTTKYFLKRMEQFNLLKKFVQKTLTQNNYKESDLVLLTGDYNVDSRAVKEFCTKQLRSLQKYETLANSKGFTEYDALISCLTDDNKNEIVDLLMEKYKEHPVTFGDYETSSKGERKPTETVLTDRSCLLLKESLDYIFQYVPKTLSENRVKSPTRFVKERLEVIPESVSVQKFFIEGRKYSQLSDHYGVQVVLRCSVTNKGDLEEAETVSGSFEEFENLSQLSSSNIAV